MPFDECKLPSSREGTSYNRVRVGRKSLRRYSGPLRRERVVFGLTPQFSGRALPYAARHARIMKWSARGVAALLFDGPLQLLVRR